MDKAKIIEALKYAIEAIDLIDDFGDIEAISSIQEALETLEAIENNPIQANDAEDYDSIRVSLSSLKNARKAKEEELIEQGINPVSYSGSVEMEFYYEKGAGLFAVEAEAVEANVVSSPYTGRDILDADLIAEKSKEKGE